MLTILLSLAVLGTRVTGDIVSRGKPTSQSSILSGHNWGGALAVNGNYDNNVGQGSCLHTEDDESPFLVVDLKGTFKIDHVVLYNRQDCCSNRMVGVVIELLSQDGQVVYQCGKITSTVNIYEIPCGNRVAQKVRVKGPRKQFLQICELDVHGEPAVYLISRVKPTSQSSIYGDMDGSLAVDGRYDTHVNQDGVFDLRNCFISEQDEMPFFTVDLQGTFRIDRVVIYNREDCCSDRMVSAVVELLYNNGEMSHECGKITDTMSIYNISCGNNLAQKVRVVGAQNSYLQLCEVDVYGKSESLPLLLSRKKPTYHSSVLGKIGSSLAVDGNYNNFINTNDNYTNRNCFHSDGGDRNYMEVNLEGKFNVNNVVLYNRMDCCSQRMVGAVVELLTKDGQVSYQCGKASDIRATYTMACANKPAYKVRVTAAPHEFLQICEMEVFGESSIKIISRSKPTSSSSVENGLDSSFAVDGIYEYDFHNEDDVNLFHSMADEEPFWLVDLQGKFNIDHVVIYNRLDCCSERMVDAVIELLTETGTVSYECGKITDTKAAYNVACGNNVAYKVRIKAHANEFLHFSEVDVFGDTAG